MRKFSVFFRELFKKTNRKLSIKINDTSEECEHTEFSKEGILLTEGQYSKGRKTGIWKEYYENGILAAELNYIEGKLHGVYKSYHINGNIWCTGRYINGCKEGEFIIYNASGKISLIQYYNNDILI